MHDRFLRGLLAGIGGALAATVVNIITKYVLHFSKIIFADFAGMLIFGRFPTSLFEWLFAFGGHLGFSAINAIIFCYLIPFLGSDYLTLKGTVYSLAMWFGAYSITLLYRVPHLTKIDLPTAISNFAASVVYGIVMVMVMSWLAKHNEKV